MACDEKWISVHIYKCDSCDLTFGVDQSFEPQSDIVCPFCRTDTSMVGLGNGEMRRDIK